MKNTALRQFPKPIGFNELKAKLRAGRADFPEPLALRVHRSLSWLQRSESDESDLDVKFMMLWVSFNAAYARDMGRDFEAERNAFQAYFDLLVSLDRLRRIHAAVWRIFPHEIQSLSDNKYVFGPFWSHQNGQDGYADWAERLTQNQRAMKRALANQETGRVLSILFDRLYVLRNQILHGGATWNSSVNRRQVGDGAAILSLLVPLFIDTMLDHAGRDWGRPFYPRVP